MEIAGETKTAKSDGSITESTQGTVISGGALRNADNRHVKIAG